MTSEKDVNKLENMPIEKNKNISFEIGYIPPFWSSKPLHKYSLDIWREGVIVQNIDISKKEYYLIGRNAALSDICLDNMTVSRAHCVIQNKDDGDIFLYDLDSIYGTFVNKSQIPKKTYIKLKVGDTFNIGRSSKMFILNGPENLSSMDDNDVNTEFKAPIPDKKEILQKRIEQIKEQYEDRENYKRNLLGLNACEADWGQRDFDEEIMQLQRDEEESMHSKENRIYQDDEYNGPFNLEELKQRKDLNDKQRNMINKIENILKGIKNVKEETLKIKKKEMDQGEITEGQKKRLQSNEAKLNDLNDKLETFENNLRISLSSKDEAGMLEHKFDKNLMKELDSEDEYYDRTKQQGISSTNQSDKNKVTQNVITENYETLKVKLEALIKNRQRLIDQLQDLTLSQKDLNIKQENETELDSLDAFISETNNQIASERKTHITKEINDTTNEINRTHRLLSLVIPSHLKIKATNDDKNIKDFYKKDHGNNQITHNTIVRDQGTLDKEKTHKKKNIETVADTIAKLNKIRKKMELANFNKKFTDSDEEIIEEVDNFKELLTKEAVMDENFQKKIEEFKRNINNKSNHLEDVEDNQKGGLILDPRTKTRVKEYIKPKNENLFGEIIENLNKSEFNMSNYSEIQNVLIKKSEEKASKKNMEIDYSKGGLQTFHNYLNEMESRSGLLNNKRGREIYGPSKKPESRNTQEKVNQDDLNDYDAIYTVGERITQEHDVSSNPFKKYNNIEDE